MLFVGKPVVAETHIPPLLVERNTDVVVPAKRSVPLTQRERRRRFPNPDVTGVHSPPLLVDRYTPPPSVPANRVVPITESALISFAINPELA